MSDCVLLYNFTRLYYISQNLNLVKALSHCLTYYFDGILRLVFEKKNSVWLKFLSVVSNEYEFAINDKNYLCAGKECILEIPALQIGWLPLIFNSRRNIFFNNVIDFRVENVLLVSWSWRHPTKFKSQLRLRSLGTWFLIKCLIRRSVYEPTVESPDSWNVMPLVVTLCYVYLEWWTHSQWCVKLAVITASYDWTTAVRLLAEVFGVPTQHRKCEKCGQFGLPQENVMGCSLLGVLRLSLRGTLTLYSVA